MRLCCNPRASRPTPVRAVSQFRLTSFVIKSLHVLSLIKVQCSLSQMLMVDRLTGADSFSYVTRACDVRRIPGVVTPEPGFDRFETPISPGQTAFRHGISRRTDSIQQAGPKQRPRHIVHMTDVKQSENNIVQTSFIIHTLGFNYMQTAKVHDTVYCVNAVRFTSLYLVVPAAYLSHFSFCVDVRFDLTSPLQGVLYARRQ